MNKIQTLMHLDKMEYIKDSCGGSSYYKMTYINVDATITVLVSAYNNNTVLDDTQEYIELTDLLNNNI